jgi:excisionase family DNA binding protein
MENRGSLTDLLYVIVRNAVRDGVTEALAALALNGSGEERPRLLNASEVAEILRLSKPRVYALIRGRQIPSIRMGRTVRVPEDLLLEWMGRRKNKANPFGGVRR